jgi:N-acyl-D-aspartate/D-glutamate deacylase
MLDLAVIGGTLVDGSGGPPRPADVGVRDGRIVAIGAPGSLDEPASRRIDAHGLVVAPGVVDLHTHYDAQLFWDPTASPSCFHGVTTVIGGNCGFTLAPAGPDHNDYLMRMMARVEGMPLAALQQGLPWDWTSFADWLGRLDGRTSVNAGFLCGHSALRRAVMGEAAVGSEASEAQVSAMAGLLDDALAAGALGLSSSQAPTHNDGDGHPVPSRAATSKELLALAAVVGGRPGTTLELIVAGCLNGFSEEEVDLLIGLSLAADRPLNWNVLGVSALAPDRWLSQLEPSTRATERGAAIVALTLPHPMQLWLSFDSGFVLDGLPGWSETMHLPRAEKLRALSDGAVRKRLAEGAASPEAGVLGGLARWELLTVAETFAPGNDGLAGSTVAEVAKRLGKTPFDALLDIVVSDDLRTGLQPPVFGNDDASWQERGKAWVDRRTIVGGSDAGAHLDMMCGAVYSTTVLGPAVRDHQVISLAEAVHQLTDVPARLYGLRHRGRVEEGWWADLVVFDPETIAPGKIHTRTDLPGDAPRLYAEATGVHHVVVNGQEIVSDGKATGDVPGAVLRSGRDTETVSARALAAAG